MYSAPFCPLLDKMRPVDLIGKKRDGGEHASAEISWLVRSLYAWRGADYQMSAWMMAALLRGLSGAETAALTEAMCAPAR